MAIRRANGVDLHVQRLGAVGPPLVLVHGLLVGSLASWYFGAAPALAERHRVLLYDLRGHGRSERVKTGYDVETLVDDLEGLVEDFPDEAVRVVGHSYGGLVALRFALRRPARVDRLALVEAPLPPARLEELQAFRLQSPEQMAEALPPHLRRLLGSGRRRARRFLESLQFLAGETTMLADLSAEGDVADADLATVGCPTLLVYGKRSSVREVGERLAGVIPGSELRLLDGGHWLPLESSRDLTEALVEFLRG